MNKSIIIIGLLVTLLIVGGCSEFGSCYNTCRNIAYLNLDSECTWVSSSLVEDKCQITKEQIIEVKNNCFEECK